LRSSGRRDDRRLFQHVIAGLDPAIPLRWAQRVPYRDGRVKPGHDAAYVAGVGASMTSSLSLRAALVSVLIFIAFLLAWHLATRGIGKVQQMDPEYAKLMGATATQGKSAMPGPLDVAAKLWEHLRRPFYDNGPNDKGLGIQLAHSIARVGLGYLLAVLVAIPIGFLIGMSPLMSKALDPFIQILKPISPLAWMPLALYTIKDSGLSAIFVIFICSLWPMMINTAFGVAAVRKEWLNVARTLEVGTLRRAFTIILPAAAPTILTGMRISIGIAWLVIVAAEMLVGGTGIGYFVWNEWNNLSITNVIVAILLIGIVGMVLDQVLARLTRLVTFPE
jgi:nitrate/nitrite transport system permease protein